MSSRALSAWIVLLGATRIDFLAGSGPLVLTPFLVLSPLLALRALWTVYADPAEARMPTGAGSFVLGITGLVTLLTLSAFLSYDLATSARRLALLVAQLYLVTGVGLVLMARPDRVRILVRGARWGILAVVAADVLQLVCYFVDPAWLTSGILDFSPGLYFGVIPRLTGLGVDPNLGGLGTLALTWLTWRFAPPGPGTRRLIRLGALCVILTLSRSAVLAGLVLVLASMLRGRLTRLTPGMAGAAALAVLALLTPYLVSPTGADALDSLGSMLGTRFTFDEGSSSQHAQLIGRGLEVATSDPKHLLLGIGYGNAYLETQDFFPGNDYGNFHSLFVTLFAEAGIFAAAWAFGLFLHAFRVGRGARSMVAALLVFNLFQQSHTEPVTWLLLCLAWTFREDGLMPMDAGGYRASRPSFSPDASTP